MGLLQVKQIYFREDQKSSLTYKGIFNPVPDKDPDLTYICLESKVIAKIIEEGEHLGYQFSGILAPNFKDKLEECKRWGRDISSRTKIKFREDKFHNFVWKNKEKDLIRFANHPTHAVFPFAAKYHPDIITITQRLLDKIGFSANLKQKNEHPVYFNYFVATVDVLDGFYKELLEPFMRLCREDEEAKFLLWQNSKYSKPFPEHLKKLYEVNHWPYHPFIAERLINLYILKHNLNIATL